MDFMNIIYAIPVVLLSLSIHEFAHGWVSYKLGDPTAKYMGRLTLNPLAHLDPMGTICMLIASISGVGIGWAKPVPINPSYYKNYKSGMRVVGLAGPMSNFILALVSGAVMYILWGLGVGFNWSETVQDIIWNFGSLMIAMNVSLGVFNLIPVPPLDGFKIFGTLLPTGLYDRMLAFEDKIGFVFLIIVIAFPGVLSMIMSPLIDSVYNLLDLVYTPLVDFIINILSNKYI